jgi:HPt (histidine-containing phosphotransfer) domain-containing protein
LKKDSKQLPPKVSFNSLRNHFRSTYKLTQDQIDIMLEASVKSLTTSFAALYAALESDDREQLFRTAHSLKGLLLNMGEKQWAELARELELETNGKNKQDYLSMVTNLEYGVEDII